MPDRTLSVCVLCAMLMQYGISTGLAQNPPDSLEINPYLEQLFENVEQYDAESFADVIEDLKREPLDLNTASAADLNRIPDLGPLLTNSIVSYRNEKGPYKSTEDLREIDGISEELIQKISPFLYTRSVLDKNQTSASKHMSFELIQRLSRVGSSSNRSQNRSSEHVYSRIFFRHSNGLSLNLTFEKDPGELFRWDPSSHTYGFDHISGNCTFRGSQKLKTLVLGDFTLNTGQGLILSHSGVFLSGRDPVRPSIRNGHGISPYGSTDENNFFRGIAATVSLSRSLQTSIFFSRNSLDASVSAYSYTDSLEIFQRVTSFPKSGLHRTEGELKRKDAVRENVIGGTGEYTFTKGKLGVAGYFSSFSTTVLPDKEPYRLFDFSGNELVAASIYGSILLTNLLLSAELGATSRGSPGGLTSIQFNLSKIAEIAVIGRIYPRNFHSPHGNAFARQSGAPQNETGVFVGLRLFPSPHLIAAAYFDQYTYPWLRYGDSIPCSGYRTLASIMFAPRKWLNLYTQIKMEGFEETEEQLDASGRIFQAIGIATKQSLRSEARYLYSNQLQLGIRIEYSRFKSDFTLQHGFLVLQDLKWQPLKSLQLNLRYAAYSIDGFQARIYAYEPDLRNAFSLPAFSGEGDRLSLLVTFQPTKSITLQTKIAQTRQEEASTSSSEDSVRSPYPGEVKIQAIVRF